MSFELLEKFRDPELCRKLLDKMRGELTDELRFMEVCGTHTVAIFQSGLRSLLPEKIVHLSGPGCPVCVTHESEVNAFLDLAGNERVILATFGDLMRVPGEGRRNLKKAQADGARIKVVYSPFDTLKLAKENPDALVVFIGVGFETTAPTIAGTMKMARRQGIRNLRVLCFHKTVPTALDALLSDTAINLDGFILPGHVSAIIGTDPYDFIAEKYGKSAVVTGFEPLDILQSLNQMIEWRNTGEAHVANNYTRIVGEHGNPKAMEIMYEVFEPCDALWRGIGMIPGSGLEIRPEWEEFDAKKEFGIVITDGPALKGCKCGDILKGIKQPDECPLFGKACTPADPVGPCMVSTEGSCAAYYKYKLD
ncbi:hydrogenase formation protein HypD [Pseudodesulfovibrio portus]|uniref:Hydrogenase expression/formation protein n=1 Tax=Pseudodesulfovibrio portus TaxID=231439 RepID=A0ABM8AUT7_9BACT|nr:hydrogenase expression/formation protein [Pseudodesulfovibrio portus]